MAHDGKATGEIVARAPWLTMGYLNDPSASERLWAGGYLHTGDMGSIDPDGTVHITDRLKDIIKSGGEWISSIDLEDIILQMEGVVKAAVIAVHDDKWGERPLALVSVLPELKGKIGRDEIRAHVMSFVEKGLISKFAVPERVEFVDALPLTSVGKIDKKKLREIPRHCPRAHARGGGVTRLGTPRTTGAHKSEGQEKQGSDGHEKANEKMSVGRLFWEQVALNFVVVAVLIACGALLTFKVMGEEYSEWTVVGFFATVFFAFIVFLPAGTLFAARAEFAKDKVEVRAGREDRRARADRQSAPCDCAFGRGPRRSRNGHRLFARLSLGWMPSPLIATLASLLFVVPYAVIV